MRHLRITRSRSLRAAILAAAVMGSAAALVVAEDLFVQPEHADVREGPGRLFDVTTTINKNSKVTVLERTDDGWVKVQTPDGKQGYIFQKELGAKPPAAPGPFAFNVTSDAEASQMGTAAAGKGLEPEAENYAKNKNYSKANLDKVIALNRTVKGKDWMQFCQDGKVGPAKPKQ
jgi:uncharacterized protein YgiM (DUF1202 family)